MGRRDTRRRWYACFSPRFAPVVLVRWAYGLATNGWPRLANLPRMLNMILFGLEVPSSLEIGPGLVFPHTQGTVLGAARIGANATIFHQVTLGAVKADYRFDPALRPVVEDEVTLSAGAKILGGLVLGNGCVVGANAVVLQSVPPGAIAVGVPARVLSSGDASGESADG